MRARSGTLTAFTACAVALWICEAGAQTFAELNSRLSELEPQADSAVTNQALAGAVIDGLDQAEADFAKLAQNPKTDRAELLAVYSRLEEMLNRLYTTYKQQSDQCWNTGWCDYDAPEQLALRALYPLSWLHFQGAVIYSNPPEQAKRLLNQAIDGFTESTLVMPDPELVRENLLGRAYSERELGKYDYSGYRHAVADFRQIISDGSNTKQYKAAKQGLATTYAAMGKVDKRSLQR